MMTMQDCEEYPDDRRNYASLCEVIRKFDLRITTTEHDREITRIKRDNRFENIQEALDKFSERMLALEEGLFGNGHEEESVNFLLKFLIKEFQLHLKAHEKTDRKAWDVVSKVLSYLAVGATGAVIYFIAQQMAGGL